jgi:hypothetical protein
MKTQEVLSGFRPIAVFGTRGGVKCRFSGHRSFAGVARCAVPGPICRDGP